MISIFVLELITEDEDGLVKRTLNSSDLAPGSLTTNLSPDVTTWPSILVNKIFVSFRKSKDFKLRGARTILLVVRNLIFFKVN